MFNFDFETDQWLRDYLSRGPKPVKDVLAAAVAAGRGCEKTVRRAAQAIRVESFKRPFAKPEDPHFWRLPATPDARALVYRLVERGRTYTYLVATFNHRVVWLGQVDPPPKPARKSRRKKK